MSNVLITKNDPHRFLKQVTTVDIQSSGTLTANALVTNSLDMQNNTINNVGAPVVATDATNKNYVDIATGGLVGQRNVLTLGFVGDGTTDNSAAMTTLLSSISAGDTILFPNGTYFFSSAINLPAGVHMVGQSAVLVFPDTTDAMTCAGGNRIQDLTFQVRESDIDTTASAFATTEYGIIVQGKNVLLHNLVLLYFFWGVRIDIASGAHGQVVIRDCSGYCNNAMVNISAARNIQVSIENMQVTMLNNTFLDGSTLQTSARIDAVVRVFTFGRLIVNNTKVNRAINMFDFVNGGLGDKMVHINYAHAYNVDRFANVRNNGISFVMHHLEIDITSDTSTSATVFLLENNTRAEMSHVCCRRINVAPATLRRVFFIRENFINLTLSHFLVDDFDTFIEINGTDAPIIKLFDCQLLNTPVRITGGVQTNIQDLFYETSGLLQKASGALEVSPALLLQDTLTVDGDATLNDRLLLTPDAYIGTLRNAYILDTTAPTFTSTDTSGTVSTSVTGYLFQAPTLASASIATFSNTSTMCIAGPPVAGPNATVSDTVALKIDTGDMKMGSTLVNFNADDIVKQVKINVGAAGQITQLSFTNSIAGSIMIMSRMTGATVTNDLFLLRVFKDHTGAWHMGSQEQISLESVKSNIVFSITAGGIVSFTTTDVFTNIEMTFKTTSIS